jgi:hypothetical protein
MLSRSVGELGAASWQRNVPVLYGIPHTVRSALCAILPVLKMFPIFLIPRLKKNMAAVSGD